MNLLSSLLQGVQAHRLEVLLFLHMFPPLTSYEFICNHASTIPQEILTFFSFRRDVGRGDFCAYVTMQALFNRQYHEEEMKGFS